MPGTRTGRASWAEVLTVARALISQYQPLKMNYETLGNSLPHLHTHLVRDSPLIHGQASRSRYQCASQARKFQSQSSGPTSPRSANCSIMSHNNFRPSFTSQPSTS